MNFFVSFILYLLLGIGASYFLPWWIIIPIGLLIGYFFKGNAAAAFLLGLLSQLIIWLGMASFLSFQNDGILIEKMGDLFSETSPIVLLLVIGLVGGISGGLSTWTGRLLKNIMTNKST